MKKIINDYDEYSPFTNEKAVFVESTDFGDIYKLDMSTGYHTYSKSWLPNSDLIQSIETSMPDYIINNKKEADGSIWYPLLHIINDKFLFPEKDLSVWNIGTLTQVDPDSDISNLNIIFTQHPTTGDALMFCVSDEVTKYDTFEEALEKFYEK